MMHPHKMCIRFVGSVCECCCYDLIFSFKIKLKKKLTFFVGTIFFVEINLILHDFNLQNDALFFIESTFHLILFFFK